jgi:hypothetical protein
MPIILQYKVEGVAWKEWWGLSYQELAAVVWLGEMISRS